MLNLAHWFGCISCIALLLCITLGSESSATAGQTFIQARKVLHYMLMLCAEHQNSYDFAAAYDSDCYVMHKIAMLVYDMQSNMCQKLAQVGYLCCRWCYLPREHYWKMGMQHKLCITGCSCISGVELQILLSHIWNSSNWGMHILDF